MAVVIVNNVLRHLELLDLLADHEVVAPTVVFLERHGDRKNVTKTPCVCWKT